MVHNLKIHSIIKTMSGRSGCTLVAAAVLLTGGTVAFANMAADEDAPQTIAVAEKADVDADIPTRPRQAQGNMTVLDVNPFVDSPSAVPKASQQPATSGQREASLPAIPAVLPAMPRPNVPLPAILGRAPAAMTNQRIVTETETAPEIKAETPSSKQKQAEEKSAQEAQIAFFGGGSIILNEDSDQQPGEADK